MRCGVQRASRRFHICTRCIPRPPKEGGCGPPTEDRRMPPFSLRSKIWRNRIRTSASTEMSKSQRHWVVDNFINRDMIARHLGADENDIRTEESLRCMRIVCRLSVQRICPVFHQCRGRHRYLCSDVVTLQRLQLGDFHEEVRECPHRSGLFDDSPYTVLKSFYV